MKRFFFLANLCAVAAMSATAADVTISKPYFRWLFNGFGFQNSEANFLRIMPEDFRDVMENEGVERAACDYISGMTDGYAMEKFGEIFIPFAWTVK